jgi:hypothetical protein
MKKSILSLLPALLVSVFAFTQNSPIIKLHVYSREVLGGAQQKKQSVSETGVETELPLTKPLQYFIYAETKNTQKPGIKNIWIGGKKHEVYVHESIIKSPVVFSNTTLPGLQNDTLVRKTSNKVWLVELKEPLKYNSNTAVSKLLAKNEALLSYQQGNTIKYLAIKKIKKLQAVAVL